MSTPIQSLDQAEPAEADEGRRMDAEVRLISAMLRMLASVDEQARIRIMAYLGHRYKGDAK